MAARVLSKSIAESGPEMLERSAMKVKRAQEIIRNAPETVKRAPFRLGQKQVFLPNFTVTLLNTPKQSPYFATFLVPLHLNKLDMRDYLLNVYNLPVHSVTSRVLLEPSDRDKGAKHTPYKKMTVRLDKPFAWPEPPSEEELQDKWAKGTYDGAKEGQAQRTKMIRMKDTYFDEKERKKLAQQASSLITGQERWRAPRGRQDGSFAVSVLK